MNDEEAVRLRLHTSLGQFEITMTIGHARDVLLRSVVAVRRDGNNLDIGTLSATEVGHFLAAHWMHKVSGMDPDDPFIVGVDVDEIIAFRPGTIHAIGSQPIKSTKGMGFAPIPAGGAVESR